MELAQAFFALSPPTQLRIRHETLSGTMESLTSGQADLALGVSLDSGNATGIHGKPLGGLSFVFAVAPHHPLAAQAEPLRDALLRNHRAVAVADSVQRGGGVTIGLLGGQDVFTVPSMAAKLDAQLRGLGCGFLPEPMARPYLETGRLVAKRVERLPRLVRVGYAWRGAGGASQGRALQWWLGQLESQATRTALLDRDHRVE
jgi:DNA-binding transcriptional LysR family regulator